MSAKGLGNDESEVDVKQPQDSVVPALEDGKSSYRAQWATTRVELWAFYVYYIVSMSLKSKFASSANFFKGKQWVVWVQFWAFAVSELVVPRWLRPESAPLHVSLRVGHRLRPPVHGTSTRR